MEQLYKLIELEEINSCRIFNDKEVEDIISRVRYWLFMLKKDNYNITDAIRQLNQYLGDYYIIKNDKLKLINPK